MVKRQLGTRIILLAATAWTVALVWTVRASPVGLASGSDGAEASGVLHATPEQAPISSLKTAMETSAEAQAASAGCVTCHTKTDEATMHPSGTVTLGCATCHGGNPTIAVAASLDVTSQEYRAAKQKAHPQPRVSDLWKTAANPERAYTAWLEESPEYIQFVNPGDLRVVDKTCGGCHAAEVRNVRTSMMTTGAMLWQAALYNNGGAPYKNARYRRELRHGRPAAAAAGVPATDDGRDAHERMAAVPRAAAALGSDAARQRPARVRARRHEEGGDRQPDRGGRARAAGREAERSRVRHGAAHRPGVPRAAEDASARSAALLPRARTISRATIAAAAAPAVT